MRAYSCSAAITSWCSPTSSMTLTLPSSLVALWFLPLGHSSQSQLSSCCQSLSSCCGWNVSFSKRKETLSEAQKSLVGQLIRPLTSWIKIECTIHRGASQDSTLTSTRLITFFVQRNFSTSLQVSHLIRGSSKQWGQDLRMRAISKKKKRPLKSTIWTWSMNYFTDQMNKGLTRAFKTLASSGVQVKGNRKEVIVRRR